MSWDNVNSWSQVLVVFFAVLALVSGLFVSARQAKELASLKEAAAKQEGENLTLKASQQRVEINLAEARQKQAEAERMLLALERKVQPRDISPDVNQRLLSILASAPKGPVTVMSLAGNGESAFFAMRIREILSRAGYNAELGSSSGNLAKPEFGLLLSVLDLRNPPPHAEPLLNAFNEAGIPMRPTRGIGGHAEVVYIFVAARQPE